MLLFALCFLPLLAGCSSPRASHGSSPTDPEIERNAAAAKAAYANGAYISAERFYQKALYRARMADQPSEIARLAYNLAVCRVQTRNYEQALALLDEAQYEAQKNNRAFPEATLLRAEILRHLGKTDEAKKIVESEIDALKKSDPARLQLRLFLAESACDQNDRKLALSELDKLDHGLLKSADFTTQAKEANARGRVLLMDKKTADAAACFDKAAKLYQNAQKYVEMGYALYEAGAAYEAGKQQTEAYDRYYRAARTLLAYGENRKAHESFNKASELAKESADKQILNALARLKAEISPEAGSKNPPQDVQP